jgi:hypothetical protein
VTRDPADPDLRPLFRALRDQDFARVPALENILARAAAQAPRTRQVPMRGWAGVSGVAVVAIGIWLILSPRPVPSDLDSLALPGWRTPTDSLLADAGDPSQRPSWATLPTAGLGRPSLNRSRENR